MKSRHCALRQDIFLDVQTSGASVFCSGGLGAWASGLELLCASCLGPGKHTAFVFLHSWDGGGLGGVGFWLLAS